MHLTIAAQNLREGGWGQLDPAAPSEAGLDRLPDLADRLKAANADILVAGEIRDQRAYNAGTADPGDHLRCQADRDRMYQLGDALGLTLAGITPSRSGIPSAVLYRRGRLKLTGWHDRFSTWFTNGCGVAVFTAAEANEPIAVAAIHADPWSWIDTAREVQRAIALVSEFHDWGIAAGDFNSAPAYGPPADLPRMRPHHRMNRLVDARGPRPERNLEPARALEEAGYVDAAAVLDACAQAPGETLHDLIERSRTGADDRIDRIHLTPALARTPVAYQRLDTHRYASDHYGIATILDLDRASTTDTED